MQDDLISRTLSVPDDELARSWNALLAVLTPRFGDRLGIEGILFLIGIQESGHGYEPRLRKELKQDLIMLGTHCVFEKLGLYGRAKGSDGSIQWTRRVDVPRLPIEDQEKLLRIAIIRYFGERDGFEVESVDTPST